MVRHHFSLPSSFIVRCLANAHLGPFDSDTGRYDTGYFAAANGQIPQINIWDDHDVSAVVNVPCCITSLLCLALMTRFFN